MLLCHSSKQCTHRHYSHQNVFFCTGCEYGDKAPGFCSSMTGDRCREHQEACCETCHGLVPTPSHPGEIYQVLHLWLFWWCELYEAKRPRQTYQCPCYRTSTSEKCSRNSFRGSTLLPCGNHFCIVYYGVRLKKNVDSVAASGVFHIINMLTWGYPQNCSYLSGWCYYLPINRLSCLITDNYIYVLMLCYTLPWSK